MHPDQSFRETDRERLARLLETELPVVMACAGSRLAAAHAPVALGVDALRFHLSARNPLVDVLDRAGRALVVVTGPNAYISPDWYASEGQVPTWNYLSAEVEGAVRRLAPDALVSLLDDLAARFELGLAPKPPWTRRKLQPAAFERLVSAIVGFELAIERLEGVRKLSQNKGPADVSNVARRLAADSRPGAAAIARLLRGQA